jgi:hypothetical protein
MKQDILQIAKDLEKGDISEDRARNLLLGLFSVSKCGHCKSKDIIDYVYCKDCLEFTPKQ